jgi:hypothetical protein
MNDDLAPRGYLTLHCSTPDCGWAEWRDPLSPDVELAKQGKFKCDFCAGIEKPPPPPELLEKQK